MAYLKIILLGLLVMVLLIVGTILVGYIYAKTTGKLRKPGVQEKKEQATYEAFAGGNLDDDNPFDTEASITADTLHAKEDDEDVIEFDDDSEDDGFSFDD